MGLRLPASVQVGYKTYAIEPQSRDDVDEDGHLGYASHDKGQIKTINEGAPQECANTLLHEILHCCCYVGQTDMNYAKEEKVVSVLTNQFLQVMRDNPGVIRFLMKHAKG